MGVVATGPPLVTNDLQLGQQLLNQATSQRNTRENLTNCKKMVAVFKYIKEHLDGNEQAIFELSKKCRMYDEQLAHNRAEVSSQLQNTE